MCLPEDAGLTHSCVQACTACYVFDLSNLELIAEGSSVKLGTLSEILIIADQGCNFCKFLLEIAVGSGKVRNSHRLSHARSGELEFPNSLLT